MNQDLKKLIDTCSCDVTIPDTEFNREELRKYSLPTSNSYEVFVGTPEKETPKECITCGSHSFKDLGDRVKCKYCGNEYF